MAPVGRSIVAAGSRRNAPPPAEGAVQDKPTSRIKNAKELRKAYVELNQSPDGADPDPLTLPKCVECGHCGWPVYPRDSRVATKKTFARAGIVRGTKKEEDAKRKQAQLEAGGAVDDGGDAESDDSRDTVERMADELEDLKDRNTELEEKNQELEAKNEMLEKELAETKEALAQAEEKIEFMEEAEQRWRDKLAQSKKEVERLKQALDRAGQVAADREGGLIKTLLELRDLREKFAAYVRRRNFMLAEFERRFERKEKEEYVAIALRMWRAATIKERLQRKLEDLEVKRQREVAELSVQLEHERDHVRDLREHRERLQARLKQAAHRLLQRSLSSSAWPSAKDHAFRALVGEHPVNRLENALERCQRELERTQKELAEMTSKADSLEEERNALRDQRDNLLQQNSEMSHELKYLKEQIGGDLEELERKRRAQEERERQHQLEIEGWKQRLQEMEEAFQEEKEGLETTIRLLESRLAAAEAAAGNKDDDGEDDDPSRVVPKGQGVLCVGCLKQLVHRAVKPLPPVGALVASSEKMEAARRRFLQKELSGSLDPNDALHSHAYSAKKDPYGVARLTVERPSSIREPTSPSSPNLLTPTTGLPALKRRPGFGGSATSLRATVREFRPRNFR